MPDSSDYNQLLEDGFILEVSRLPDTPLARQDRMVYTEESTGRILIARAPLRVDRAPT